MKKYIMTILLTFLASNFLVFGYLSPLEDISRYDIMKEAGEKVEAKKISEIEKEIELERNPRGSYLFFEEEEASDARLILYLDPAAGYGPRDDYKLIEAIQYKYSDGSTKVISYDGEVLKGK